ncbi:MAG: Translation initiation factor C-terminal domain, partial [Anaerosporomusa subterranea]|nr:Translation initiation factor C-terminal domain [Anaerosporomusa subterranea]
AELKDLVILEREPKLEGKNMIMILAPKAVPQQQQPQPQPAK